MRLSLYSALNSKLYGMYAKRINREQIGELVKQNSTKQAISLLKYFSDDFKELEDNSGRRKIKAFLESSLRKDIKKIYRLLNRKDKELFSEFISIYEFKHIQNSSLEWDKKSDMFKEKNKLDKLYFEKMMKLAKKQNSVLENQIGQKIDLNNISWIYREKKNFKFEKSQIKQTLIKVNYKLNKSELNHLIEAENEVELIEILKTTDYAKYIDFSNMQNLESNIDRYLYKVYQKDFRSNILNNSILYSYLNIVELENNDIINIIEGIRYRLEKQEIYKRLVKEVGQVRR